MSRVNNYCFRGTCENVGGQDNDLGHAGLAEELLQAVHGAVAGQAEGKDQGQRGGKVAVGRVASDLVDLKNQSCGLDQDSNYQ